MMTMKNDATQGVPVPPEEMSIGAIVIGSGTIGTEVTLTVTPPNVANSLLFKTEVTSTGRWFVYNIGNQPLGTKYSATACYPGGAPSDPYIRVLGIQQSEMLTISSVSASSVTGRAQQGQEILGWREADGQKVLDYQMNLSSGTNFNAAYLPNVQIAQDDVIFFVSAYPDGGSMTPFNVKPVGYVS